MSLTENQIQQIEDYLKGKLSKEELLVFEKELETNSKLQEYLDIAKQMEVVYGDDNWLFAQNKDSEDLKTMEGYLNSEEGQQAKFFFEKMKASNTPVRRIKKSYVYIAIAASLLLLLTIPFVLNSNLSYDELYANYSDYSNLPSFVSRNNAAQNRLAEAEELFKNKNYKDALELFQSNLEASNNKGSIYIYQGLSQIELQQYNHAEQTFNTLIGSGLIDSEKGYWYKALLYLKQDKKEESKAILNRIISESLFNYEKAKDLLNEL
ncbi:CDC27 family protein [Psychroserpens luteolus]|uniref:CDC27 family protein n=1 Tax=Psychroserpens luteolus TaxID=2855840 RepID=UPI001E4B1F11|nr:CDC27 family protein [Psychroserpens luteolus]MCD2260455.1 CDC27 family protein [Psychroserpens luteolus]